MSFLFISTLLSYIRQTLAHVPWTHWAVLGVFSLGLSLFFLKRKKSSVYGAIALSITAFISLFLMDAAVVIRYFGMMHHVSGYDLTLSFSRFWQRNGQGLAEIISNIAVFIPLGFFLSEFLSTTKRIRPWRRLESVTMVSFCLSLCTECLQLILHVGFFELKDLVLNTVGGFIGAGLSLLVRAVCARGAVRRA